MRLHEKDGKKHQICDLWMKTMRKMGKEHRICDLWIKTVRQIDKEHRFVDQNNVKMDKEFVIYGTCPVARSRAVAFISVSPNFIRTLIMQLIKFCILFAFFCGE